METNLITAQVYEETICDKLDVVTHERTVHADQGDGESVGEELLLYSDRLPHYAVDTLLSRLPHYVGVQQTGKVCVQTLQTQ